ncbi:MAG: hypothetical protein IJY90_00955 [Clostridia bacterium]|nr:hypothetical protein [Clostridia bacterium]
MKKSTKILLIIYIIFLIPSLIFGKYLFSALKPTDAGFSYDFNVNSIIALVLNAIATILGTILYFRFINSLAVDKAIFFSSLPLIIVYGVAIFLLAQLPSYKGEVAQSAVSLLNVSAENNYNTILWAILITLIFMLMLFFNFFVLCKPVGRVEKIVDRLGDGKVKEEKIKVGGGKQFHSIEHGLNKINNNYREKDKTLKAFKIESEKYIPKQFFRFLGKNNISQLELGHQVKKQATTMLIKLIGISNGTHMSLEENFQFVNSYVNVVSPLIRKFGGFIDKYLGEGILAVFSSSQDALDCIHAVSRAIFIKNRQAKSLPNVELRASISSGEVSFGVIGDDQRKIPTIVSETASNLERIDDIAKLIGARVLFSKTVLDSLPLHYKFAYRNVGYISIEQNQIIIFEDLDVYHKDQARSLIKSRSILEKGVMLYSNGDYENALTYFEEALKINSSDKCAYVYFNKCKDKLS